jgi:hypothetical protein
MLKLFAGICVALLVVMAALASPALGRVHRAHYHVAGHYDAIDIWHPDTRSVA